MHVTHVFWTIKSSDFALEFPAEISFSNLFLSYINYFFMLQEAGSYFFVN